MRHTVSMKENHLFHRLYTKGKHAATATLAMYIRPNRLGRNRLGLTVGTKVGKAVIRNRTRRRIREAYRIHENKVAAGWDIVVVARVRSAFVPYAQLEKDLLWLLGKLGVTQK